MTSLPKDDITIVGAGLAGSLLAIFLARRGFPVRLFERRPDARVNLLDAGRSINLAISLRGLKALEYVGLQEDALRIAIPMRGRLIHHEDGGTDFQPYGKTGTEAINSISRPGLNKILMTAAEKAGTPIIFQHNLRDVDFTSGLLTFHDEKNDRITTHKTTRVIGTDGTASVMRENMAALPDYESQVDTLAHGYKELVMPAGSDGSHQLEPNALHIWPRKSFMLIALPNLDKSFTCTLFLPMEGEISFAALRDAGEIERFFAKYFPDALKLIPDVAEQFNAHPTGKLQTVRCFPWNVGGKALILGDAAHGVVPFYGQGMNCAFESCAILDRMLPDATSWEQLFRDFGRQRKPDADAIAAMALENFVEMRDKVGDKYFLLKKEVARQLGLRYGEGFISQYSLVTFSTRPYAYAEACGTLQEKLLEELCRGLRSPDDLDWARADKLMVAYQEHVARLPQS